MKILKEFWKSYPVWYVITASLMMMAFFKLNIPFSFSYVLTFLFPFSFFVLYMIQEGKDKGDKFFALKTSAVVLILLILILVLIPRKSIPEVQLKFLYELTGLPLLFLLFFHGFTRMKRRDIIYFFLITFIYGISMENDGIRLGFFFEDNYHFYLFNLPAPVITMFSWTGVFYASYFIYRKIEKFNERVFGKILIGAFIMALIALFWDLNIDPVASSKFVVFWRWNSLYRDSLAFMGVPVINFVSWFWEVFTYSAALLFMLKKDYSGWKAYVYFIMGAVIARITAIGSIFLTMIILEGLHGPTVKLFAGLFHP